LIIDAEECQPLAGIAVDIWQADAEGLYSGFPNQLGGLDTTGEVFMRGTQITDSEGRVSFSTLYPGWYPGRTTHIHFRVYPTETSEATSQLYFPEDVSAAVYRTGVYAERGPKDTSNERDLGSNGGLPPLLTMTEQDDGYLGELTIAVAT